MSCRSRQNATRWLDIMYMLCSRQAMWRDVNAPPPAASQDWTLRAAAWLVCAMIGRRPRGLADARLGVAVRDPRRPTPPPSSDNARGLLPARQDPPAGAKSKRDLSAAATAAAFDRSWREPIEAALAKPPRFDAIGPHDLGQPRQRGTSRASRTGHHLEAVELARNVGACRCGGRPGLGHAAIVVGTSLA